MSRLETSIETAKLRDSLLAKNLYTPNNIYEINNPAIINAVNALANIALPFKSFDITNTVLGRVIGPNTPIAQIGLVQLAKQLSQTVISQGSAEIIPTFNLGNLFDKNPNTKFAIRKIDYRITRDEQQSNISRILETLVGTNLRRSPFTPQSTDIDYIRNTGKGQLLILTNNLSRNFYRNSSNQIYGSLENQGFPLLSTYYKIEGYISDDAPYKSDADAKLRASQSELRMELSKNNSAYQEYGGSLDKNFSLNNEFIAALGRTDNNNFSDEFEYFERRPDGHYDDDNQIIWGKTDVSEDTLEVQKYSRDTNVESESINKFGSRIGLLKHTAQLLNAYGGNLIDQTRKKFYRKTDISGKGKLVGFNGSALYNVPENSIVRRYRENAPNEGLRQHTVLDQYNRFAKAIRFEGNYVYNGNPNSVIYERVIPNITPMISKSSQAINKKVMFSIENLAFQLNEEGNVIGLPEGMPNIQLPKCEIGPNYGRLMWFAPYDINLEEQATAKWEQVNFIGRNEPMYTYGFSERSATLSFKLIIDYPPQIKGFTTNKEFADFFAFGGEATPKETYNLSDKVKKRDDIVKQIETLREKTVIRNYKDFNYSDINIFFPNDIPKIDANLNTTIQNDIIDANYETGNQSTNIYATNNDNLNSNFVELINNRIQSIKDDDTIASLEIIFEGNASKLYIDRSKEFDYNKELSERRAIAVKNFFEQKFKEANNGKTMEELGATVTIVPNSSILAPESTRSADSINLPESKKSRYVRIIFRNKGVTEQQTIENQTNINQEEIDNLIEAKDSLDKEISRIKAEQNYPSNCIFNPFTIEDGKVRGFNYIRENKFVPVFYSQTPEDFHKRLTFLQQCVRQGAAMRMISSNGEQLSSKNSVFGRQPVCILRIGDFFHTKVIIESINFNYSDAPWDTNPEGMGMQYMICDISMSMKVIGGQSLRGPIDALQNAIGFNYYANSTYYDKGVYALPKKYEDLQYGTDDPKNISF